MNIGRMMTGPDDLGYDPGNWVEAATAGEVETWLEQLNDDAAHNDENLGETARALLKAVALKVAQRHGA